MAVLKTEAQPAAKPTRVGLIDRFSVVLIAVAATMWASDTYFRAQLIGHLTPSQIVVVEDALVSLFLVTFLLRGIPEMRRLDRRGWLAIGLIAVGPQAVATILFTTSFSYRHFAETFVLQQTQPLIAIVLAWIILGERRRAWFWPAAALAIRSEEHTSELQSHVNLVCRLLLEKKKKKKKRFKLSNKKQKKKKKS